MGTSLRLASMILLVIGAHLIIPKIVETTAVFSTLTRKGSETAVNDIIINDTLESDVSENGVYKAVSNNSYEPPNYGGPDSQHGSGTR